MFEANKHEDFTAPPVGQPSARVHDEGEFGVTLDKAEEMGAIRCIGLDQEVDPENAQVRHPRPS
jgi:hypothetical protein